MPIVDLRRLCLRPGGIGSEVVQPTGCEFRRMASSVGLPQAECGLALLDCSRQRSIAVQALARFEKTCSAQALIAQLIINALDDAGLLRFALPHIVQGNGGAVGPFQHGAAGYHGSFVAEVELRPATLG